MDMPHFGILKSNTLHRMVYFSWHFTRADRNRIALTGVSPISTQLANYPAVLWFFFFLTNSNHCNGLGFFLVLLLFN